MKRITSILLAIVTACTFYLNANATTKEIPIPENVQLICADAGEEFNVCPTILMALVWMESRGEKKNLTQITNVRWFKEGINELGLGNVKKNQKANVRLCAWYLAKWCEETEDMGYALMCWNLGENNVPNSYKVGRYNFYSRKILELSAEWEDIYYESERLKNG